jgi:hypothetical protein
MEAKRSQLAHAELRAKIMRKAIPPGYRPMVHLLFPSLFGLTMGVVALALLRDLRLSELWTIPITFVVALGFEWRTHKDILHRRLPLLSELYERHERMHHVVYTADDMEMRSRDEMALVLMPWFAVVLVTLLLFPVAFFTAWLVSRNSGLLAFCTGVAFFVSYEWLHCSYHLPASHPIARLWVIRQLSALHRCHHDPPNMKRWNFNVTIPLFDLLHRSLKRSNPSA